MKSLVQRSVYLVLVIISLWTIKPNFIFKPTGVPREWGTGMDQEGYKKTLIDLRWCILMTIIILLKLK